MVLQVRDRKHPLAGKIAGKVPRNILYPGYKHLLCSQDNWIDTLIQDVGSGAILPGDDGRERR